jgi:hypothetical protein
LVLRPDPDDLDFFKRAIAMARMQNEPDPEEDFPGG